MPAAERRRRVGEALERVSMAHRSSTCRASCRAASSSASLWRAHSRRSAILLADEPTGNLDSTNGEAVMDLLRDLHQQGSTICMVTHDNRFSRYAQRTIQLFDGRVVDEKRGH